jgi:hypothetical protein
VYQYGQTNSASERRTSSRRSGRVRGVARGRVRGRSARAGDGNPDGRKTENSRHAGGLRRREHHPSHFDGAGGADRSRHYHPEGCGNDPSVLLGLTGSCRRVNARALVIAITAASVLALFCLVQVAQARTFAPSPGPSGGLVENPDGTYSLWGEGGTKPLRTYTAQAAERIAQEDAAISLEAGSNGQTSSVVEGITKTQQEQVDDLVSKLRTGETYKTVGEANLGEDVVAEAEAEGTIPVWGDVVATVGSVGAGIAWGGAAAFVGVEVGNLIDRVVGLPELTASIFSDNELPEHCAGEHGFACEHYEERQKWDEHGRIVTKARTCSAQAVFLGYSTAEQSTTDICNVFEMHHQWAAREEYLEGKVEEYDFGNWLGDYNNPGSKVQMPCYPSTQVKGGSCVEEGSQVFNIVDLTKAKSKAQECKPPLRGVCYPKHAFIEPAFPTPGVGKTAEGEAGTVAPPPHLPTPVKPKKANELSPKVVTYIVIEHPEEFPEAEPETEQEEKEKEEDTPIPNPIWPELPAPSPNELGTEYKSTVETDGYEDVEIHVLPETSIDPRVGPGEVSKVRPDPNHKYDPKTKVDVWVDPETAGPGEGGKLPPFRIGGITEPELKPPHLNILCEKFPFGVPCWLIAEINSWSSTGSAPELGLEDFTVKGKKITGGKFDFARLEPVMEKIRPFEIAFSTIGLVILFYSFATGGNAGVGSSTKDSGDSSDESED